MDIVITLKAVEDGEYKIDIKPAAGRTYQRAFTKEGLSEYLETTKNYCEHKGYDFIYKNESEKQKVKHGGKREGAGRAAIGTTKKVSLTLPDEVWEMIEDRKKTWGASQSQTLRLMIEGYFYSGNES